MNTPNDVPTVSQGIRVALGASSLAAVLMGVLILLAPMKTASIITLVLALYAVVSGLVYAGIAVFSRKVDARGGLIHAALGALFLVVGVIALTDLGNTTQVLATLVAITIGVVWVVEGMVALSAARRSGGGGATYAYAALCVVAGIVAILAPFSVARFLWLILGLSLVLLGLLQGARALGLGRPTGENRAPRAAA